MGKAMIWVIKGYYYGIPLWFERWDPLGFETPMRQPAIFTSKESNAMRFHADRYQANYAFKSLRYSSTVPWVEDFKVVRDTLRIVAGASPNILTATKYL